MEKYYYICDCASLAVYCGGSIIRIRNNYGDGRFKVYVFDNNKEFDEYKNDHKKYGIKDRDYDFVACHYFKQAKILNYDCYENLDDTSASKHTLAELNGTYAVIVNYGKIYFVKWGD
jgi:hypothetical protein